jgi:hypothetical protein
VDTMDRCPVALTNLGGPFAVSAGAGALSPQGWFALVVGLTFAVWLLADRKHAAVLTVVVCGPGGRRRPSTRTATAR